MNISFQRLGFELHCVWQYSVQTWQSFLEQILSQKVGSLSLCFVGFFSSKYLMLNPVLITVPDSIPVILLDGICAMLSITTENNCGYSNTLTMKVKQASFPEGLKKGKGGESSSLSSFFEVGNMICVLVWSRKTVIFGPTKV